MKEENSKNSLLDALLPTNDGWETARLRKVYVAIFLTVALLVLDILADTLNWLSVLSHLLVETAAVALLLGLLVWLQWQLLLAREETQSWQTRAHDAEQDVVRWKQESQDLLAGLGQAIDRQFAEWQFTDAEREVGLLLLKGLSFKEIADVRKTSERTVRQQAGELYRKSSLRGRSEFSAFFLEDLLLPRSPEPHSAPQS
jgi:DNA-binding CsgD family transcriptional regulator